MALNKTEVALAVIVLVAAAVGIGWWRETASVRALAAAVPTAAEVGGAVAATPNSPLARRDSARLPPLPALGTPLAVSLPELKRRAAAGESPVACRLAAELGMCRGLRSHREDHERWLAERRLALELSTAGKDQAAAEGFSRVFEQELELRERRLQARERHCAGVEPPTGAELAARWRHAARLGDPAAMRHYASGRAFGWGSILDGAALFPQYRQEAEDMARERVRAGDLAMTLQLAAASAPLTSRTRSLLGQVVAEDVALSVALYRVALAALETVDSHNARRVATDIRGQLDLLEGDMTPDQQRHARALQVEAQAWSPVRLEDLNRQTSVHGIDWSGNVRECQGNAGSTMISP